MRAIEAQKEVVAARKQRAVAEDKLADAKADEDRKRQKLQDAEQAGAEGIAIGRAPSGLKKAREELAQAEQERRVAQEGVNLTHNAEKEAYESARVKMRRAVAIERSKRLSALNAALEEARHQNDELIRVQNESIDILGTREAPERAHWPELVEDTDHDSRLKAWRTYFNLNRTTEPEQVNGTNGTTEPEPTEETDEACVW